MAGTPLNFRWLGTAVLLGIGGLLILIALASRAEILGLFVFMAVSAVIYLFQSRNLPVARENYKERGH